MKERTSKQINVKLCLVAYKLKPSHQLESRNIDGRVLSQEETSVAQPECRPLSENQLVCIVKSVKENTKKVAGTLMFKHSTGRGRVPWRPETILSVRCPLESPIASMAWWQTRWQCCCCPREPEVFPRPAGGCGDRWTPKVCKPSVPVSRLKYLWVLGAGTWTQLLLNH